MSKRRPTSRQRKAVWQRALGCCEYCRTQERFADYSFPAEHIIPWSRGGKTELDNLALSCQGCNAHKSNSTEGIDPETGTMALLFHPRRQACQDHFAWNSDFSMIAGLTSTGRATIIELQLNRPGVVNLRLELYKTGNHPPEDVEKEQVTDT